MTKVNDGGPAFPITPENEMRADGWVGRGMTLRDYFAAQALAGLAGRKFRQGDAGEGYAEWAASMAYEFADALLAARGAQ